MLLRFTKMHGAGNDFVVLDATHAPLALTPAQVRRLSDRRLGVGADQILVVERSSTPGVDFRYRIYNSGGDEVEHCGNGARCFVRYVHDHGLTDKTTVTVETVNNRLELRLLPDGTVTVDMNRPLFDPAALPFDAGGLLPRRVGAVGGKPESGFELWPLALADGAAVEVAVLSMGNPHAVMRVDDVDAAPVGLIGPQVEQHPRFARHVNAGFLQVLDRGHVRLRVHERGAGETLACVSPAPALRWLPASAWAGSTARWRSPRAAACCASSGPTTAPAC
jgi:diaminopimelate epimerase